MALSILCIAGTVLHPWTAQPASRYLLTVAVVDDHTLTLDNNKDLLQIDHARYHGHYYSDKAPYQPLLAAPFYQAFRALGGNAFPHGKHGHDPDASFHWGRWWVGFWSATVPAMALVILLHRLVIQVRPAVATPVALALSLGTMLLPFSGMLFGHVLSALFLTGGWILIRRPEARARALFFAGVLLAASVGTEYPLAIPVAVLGVVALLAHGLRGAVALITGGVVGAVPLMAYNWLTFQDPFSVSYQGHLPNFQGSGALGVYNLVGPQADELRKALIGDRGLLTLTPVAAMAVAFAVLSITERSRTRRDGLLALVVLVAMWIMSAGIDGYGGSSPGPRYLIPVLPFLAIPLADAWARFPRICGAATVFGVVAMVTAVMTDPLVNTAQTHALRGWVNRFLNGEVSPSIPGELVGTWGLYGIVATGLAAAVTAILVDRRLGSAS